MIMEIVNIEASAFMEMNDILFKIEKQLKGLNSSKSELNEWLDNQDVCMLLNISPRTLQTLRDNGTLAYSQINHKTYYKPQDVEKALPLVEQKRKRANHQGKEL